MKPEILDALRRVIYHRIKTWEAGDEAEQLIQETDVPDGVSVDVETTGGDLDYFCMSIDNAKDALTLSEDDLKKAFPELWAEGEEDEMP